MKTRNAVITAAIVALSGLWHSARAEDAYYRVPLASLKLTDGSLPAAESWTWARLELESAMQPYAIIKGEGDAYVSAPVEMRWSTRTPFYQNAFIAVRAPKGKDVTGQLFLPQTNFNGMAQVKFTIASGDAKADAQAAYTAAKRDYYQHLQNRSLPGAAWFRHQAMEASGTANRAATAGVGGTAQRPWRASEVENSFELFTGGRALSENLQLDRVLPTTQPNGPTVELTNLAGITVQEMNWKDLIRDAKPELDPLAAYIPADQHAVFFPSFHAMTQMIDEADANGTPVLQLLEPRSEEVDSRNRYQTQLCLGMNDLSRLLGPQVVASVAFTGSDPFLRVGTDLAVLFEARNAEVLRGFINARQKAAQAATPGAEMVSGRIDDIEFTGVLSPERTVSSYLAVVSNVVLVSNSRIQLATLIQTARGGKASLSSRDEYAYFRNRYRRNEGNETAFVVLSDATIRRWCGPRWRIADSRRTRAAAVLAELQASHLDELASGQASDSLLPESTTLADGGVFRLTRTGVISSTYGSLNFMTPIAEMPIDRVTKAEADGYQRWRDSYQRNWRQFFDPIAIRFSVSNNRLGAELTVMPLIMASEYRDFQEVGSGAEIAPDAGDPHSNSLVHLAFAINTHSKPVESAGNFVGTMAPTLKANAFGWLGSSISVYADDDPFWDRLRAATNADSFLEENFPSLPVALHFEVKNPLGLAAFLSAVHAFVDQSAPQMTTWQNLDYNNQPYVKVTARSPAAGDGPREVAVYYAATPRSLVVTLNEKLLQRALDRQSARASAATNGSVSLATMTWLGKNVAATAQRKFVDVLQVLTENQYESHLQLLAWNNIPILNEWKRLYPDKDPVKFHEQVWGTRLLCPGGGTYVWNEEWHTMESTVFGHPGKPKTGQNHALEGIISGQLGVSFENQGLSAKGIIDRARKN